MSGWKCADVADVSMDNRKSFCPQQVLIGGRYD